MVTSAGNARLFRLARFASWLRTPLRALAVALAAAVLTSSPDLAAGERQARKLFERGQQAEFQQNYDEALALYEQARQESPQNHRYELAMRRLRFVAAQAHVDRGRRLRDEGMIEEAMAHFERAVQIDRSSQVAAQQLRRTMDLLERMREQDGDGGSQDESGDGEDLDASPVEQSRSGREKMVESLKEPPRLRPLSTQPIDITMSQQAKVVFETIAKLAGVNVIFDPEFQDKKIDISIQNATLPEALDYVSLIAKTYWKPIGHNAIFVTNDSANKRRDYEEEVVKTIYLNNVATPQELQEIVTAIRGLTDIRRMFPVTAMNALVLRGSEAKLALAEKVIHDIDKARPEVIIDVLVLEASRSRTRDLGISPVSGGVNGISLPIGFQGISSDGGENGSGTSGSGVPLSGLRRLTGNDWVTTLPGAQLTALFSASDTNLLQSPRIRALDNQQASLRIGDRIPIATGSFQPGIGGVGMNPLVNTQFTFTDVGVNVDVQPRIHNDREVSLHVEIEISTVRDRVDIGGIEQPVIGQRTISHDIRLEEGEASVLGGLNQSQVFRTRSGVPFLAEIPIVGRLFSITRVERQENEILVVLIPHIVRLPTINLSNLREVASGTDQIFQVRYDEGDSERAALPPIGAAAEEERRRAAAAAPAEPAPRPTPAQPSPADPGAPPPAPSPEPAEEPVATAPAAPAEEPAEEPAATPRLQAQPGAPSVAAGEQTTVSIVVDNAPDLFGIPLRIQFDQRVVRLVEVARGDFLAGPEMTDLIFSRNIRNEVGQAAVNLSRFPGTGGASGSGVIVTLTFEGVASGNSVLRVAPAGARDANGRPVQVEPFAGQITVR